MRMFREFHDKGKFVKSLNTMFIVMIPKKGEQKTSRIFALSVWWVVCTSCWLKF